MNEESKTQHCGDSCGAVAAMAVAFREYVPPEQRMATAIRQVLSGEMSQRGAAEANGVAESTLRLRLKEVRNSAHPTKTQASTEALERDKRPTRRDIQRELRQMASRVGLGLVNGKSPHKAGTRQVYDALIKAGHDVPEELIPPSIKSKTNEQQQPVNDHCSVVTDWADEGIAADNPIFADKLDIDAVRQHVCAEVQRSNRPADFKRAVELLTELDVICTNAWYRRQPEPWEHDDWAHISSEIDALHSIVWQRATETADELLRKSTAVQISATSVA
jgi:transposase-like protein